MLNTWLSFFIKQFYLYQFLKKLDSHQFLYFKFDYESIVCYETSYFDFSANSLEYKIFNRYSKWTGTQFRVLKKK